MALPLRSNQPVQHSSVHAASRAVGPCRQGPSPRRSQAVLTVAGGDHGQRRRTVLARCAIVAVGIVAFVAVTEAATLVGPHVPPASSGATVAGRGVAFRVVQPGETLWSIAADLDGGGDIRARVDRLARLNGGVILRAGETIRVPVEWAEALP